MHIPNGAAVEFGLSSVTVLPRIRTLFPFTLFVLQYDGVSLVSKRCGFFNCTRERVVEADYVGYVALFVKHE